MYTDDMKRMCVYTYVYMYVFFLNWQLIKITFWFMNKNKEI